jgi:hypothetical protein
VSSNLVFYESCCRASQCKMVTSHQHPSHATCNFVCRKIQAVSLLIASLLSSPCRLHDLSLVKVWVGVVRCLACSFLMNSQVLLPPQHVARRTSRWLHATIRFLSSSHYCCDTLRCPRKHWRSDCTTSLRCSHRPVSRSEISLRFRIIDLLSST